MHDEQHNKTCLLLKTKTISKYNFSTLVFSLSLLCVIVIIILLLFLLLFCVVIYYSVFLLSTNKHLRSLFDPTQLDTRVDLTRGHL